MRVRKLSADGDMVFGHGQNDFWVNVPDGPAQCCMTRLELQVGDWFLDLTEGTAWKTQVLGKYTGNTRDPMLRARMQGTAGVKSIISYASQVNRDTRSYSVQATIDTVYGGIAVVPMFTVTPPPAAAPSPILTPLQTQSGNPIKTQSGQQLFAQR